MDFPLEFISLIAREVEVIDSITISKLKALAVTKTAKSEASFPNKIPFNSDDY